MSKLEELVFYSKWSGCSIHAPNLGLQDFLSLTALSLYPCNSILSEVPHLVMEPTGLSLGKEALPDTGASLFSCTLGFQEFMESDIFQKWRKSLGLRACAFPRSLSFIKLHDKWSGHISGSHPPTNGQRDWRCLLSGESPGMTQKVARRQRTQLSFIVFSDFTQ